MEWTMYDRPDIVWSLTEAEKEALRRRIPEAAEWTHDFRRPLTRASVRSEDLCPEGYSDTWLPWEMPPEWVEEVSRKRASILAERSGQPPSLESALTMGFILAHDIDVCMRDGLAADESPFFDESDTSPWDTWLLLTTHVKEDGRSLSVLLSWVPGAYDEEVDVAASLSATACFFRTDAAKLGILAREALPDRASRLQNAGRSFMERLLGLFHRGSQ